MNRNPTTSVSLAEYRGRQRWFKVSTYDVATIVTLDQHWHQGFQFLEDCGINISMKLTIKTLHQSVWHLFGFQHAEAIADRDDYRAKLRLRLGPEIASQIQRHVDAAMKRIQIVVDPAIMSRREFYELLALEQTIDEVRQRIDATAVFVDTDSFLPALGMSWAEDVVPLLDDQGSMPTENVVRFLAMVRAAEDESEGRRRLVEFLERAVKAGEPVKCEL